LSSKYDSQKGIVKLNAIAGVIGLLFSIGAIIAVYAIVQKRRSRQQINLGIYAKFYYSVIIDQKKVYFSLNFQYPISDIEISEKLNIA